MKQTALNEVHRRMGARMVEFGGWEMPVEYSGIVEEHLAVRTRAGLFDVSHMGEIEVRGPKAFDLLQFLTPNDLSRLQIFQAQYSALMCPNGSAVDDCLIHWRSEDDFFICVNAANTASDFHHIASRNPFTVLRKPKFAMFQSITLNSRCKGRPRPRFCGRYPMWISIV